jgi:hypothetical protein
VASSHREGLKQCCWSLTELIEGTTELGTMRSSLAMAMCLARVGSWGKVHGRSSDGSIYRGEGMGGCEATIRS